MRRKEELKRLLSEVRRSAALGRGAELASLSSSAPAERSEGHPGPPQLRAERPRPLRCHLPRVHSTYCELYRMRTDRHFLHQKLVTFARSHGVKAAVREFACSRNTIRKWLRRHQPGKPSSLAEKRGQSR